MFADRLPEKISNGRTWEKDGCHTIKFVFQGFSSLRFFPSVSVYKGMNVNMVTRGGGEQSYVNNLGEKIELFFCIEGI